MTSRFSRAPKALLYVCGWLPLLVLYSFMIWRVQKVPLAVAVGYAVAYLLPAVALGAALWHARARLPWSRWRGPVIAAGELTTAVAYTIAWNLCWVLEVRLLGGSAGRRLAAAIVADLNFGWELAFGALIYGVQAGIWHAVRILGQLREKEISAAKSESLRVRSEMEALRGRLDPHFLFNGLHSITALVREDPARAEEALLQFSALLRRVLAAKADASDAVSLGDEMDFVHDYLAIERLRLGDRLRLSESVSDEANAQVLPAFSVQPLVENAIRHAVAPRREGGAISIEAKVRDGRLIISVVDDGPGADPAIVAGAKGVGLSVIRQRLRLQYGETADLSVETQSGKGFRVVLDLPALQEDAASGFK